jgi:hypothetical protein
LHLLNEVCSIIRHWSSVGQSADKRRGRVAAMVAGSLLAVTVCCGSAQAQPTLRQGAAAYHQGNYPVAAQIFGYLAQRGNAEAQAFLGVLYEKGLGVPQNYTQAAIWYRRAAEQGHTGGQYKIGLLYDRGQGVPQDTVQAEKWLILATAGSVQMTADDHARIRDAVRSKMTRGEIAQARFLALSWLPRPEQ